MTAPAQGSTVHKAAPDLPGPTVSPYLGLAVATVTVSCAAILIKLSNSPPLTLAAYRMAITALLLLPLLRQSRRLELRALDGGTKALLLFSGVLLALHFALWTASLSFTSVASSVLFVSVHPALVAAIAWPLLGERLQRGALLGILLTLAGSVIIAGGDLRLSGTALRGDLLAFLGAVAIAGYLLIGRDVRRRLDAITYSVPVYAVCAGVLGGLAFPFHQSLLAVGPKDLLIFMALAVICTLGGHLLYNWTLRYLTATVVSTSFLGEPVIASLLAWLLLGQHLPGSTLAGGAVVLVGIWLTARY